jgi:spore maturation protein CgeB
MPKNPLNNMYQGYGIYNNEKAFIFNKSKIIVNNLLYSEVEGVNARCFEVAAAKGFQLIDFKPSLNELFSIDKEIVTFSGIKDLKEKIKYWLPRDEERLNIAEAAFIKVISNHTYKHRLEEIMLKINLT